MGKQRLYCDVEFLDKFTQNKPDASIPTVENIARQDRWNNFFKVFLNCNIYFDDLNSYKEKVDSNDIFKYLWKQSTQNAEKVNFLNEKYPDLNKLNKNIKDQSLLTSTFLTGKLDNEKCDKIKSDFGVMVLNNESIMQNDELYIHHEELIELNRNTDDGWDFLKTPYYPSNSLCIIDNYIFKDLRNIEDNLIPILDIILPQKSIVDYHITIFTLNKDFDDEDYVSNFEIKQQLINKIKKIRPNNFRFSIYIIKSNKSNYHDRYIVTNNLIVKSGGGFDVFKLNDSGEGLKIKRSTTIERIHPIFYHASKGKSGDKNINLFDFLVNKMSEDYKKLKTRQLEAGRPVNFSNRLLED